ncbi:cytochrome C oxidase subunit IV family protein [Anaeromyxobacter sp. Fw109-5]|uniref:cytochrome C oxidase subunit IV family protein n=1 Tax=Anaeromyxobacter sp. (strain Fw109-5) TaxID=404589 RepID=UPI0000ED7FE8|nr:cytochrome C oxidase subunit IV family protein [Anaeromyxobacter sp. Fw109-5]ABS27063.1 caa(3)-type oxidase, subunit IV [Anaeromyxobacter sp. Fw109-5]
MADLARAQGATAHGAVHRRQYVVVFVVLGVLTLVELGVARTPGIARAAVVLALVSLAVAKAALIALFYMHLRFETRILRLTVLGPLLAPAAYGVILIAERAWRATS